MMPLTSARLLSGMIFSDRKSRRRKAHRPWLETLERRVAPTVTLSISNPMPFPKPDSGQYLGMFVVTRSGDLAPAVQVDYQTHDGTGTNGAHAGTDYVATAGELTFAADQTTATIAVPIIGNNIFQADKTFTVSLSNPQSSALDFAPQRTFATGSEPFQVAVGDFNGDGKPDLVVANYAPDTVSVLLNTTPPGATTPSFAPQQTFAVGSRAGKVVVGDFNGDGKPDLAIVHTYGADTVAVLLNTTPPGATTPSFAAPQTFATGSRPLAAAVADFNGDGKPDLAIANNLSGTVSVLLNTTPSGATVPSFAPQQTFAVGTRPDFIAVGDFNGDNKPDLTVLNRSDNTVSVLLNTTPVGATIPSFAVRQTFAVDNAPTGGLAVGDVNGDGKPDLVVTNYGSNTVSVLLNTTPAGATTASFAPQQTFAVGDHPLGGTLGDFNGDGKLDIAVSNEFANTVSVLLNTTARGATTASFAPLRTFATGNVPDLMAVGDFHGDGRPDDLAVPDYNSGTVSVLLNDSVTLDGNPATGTVSSAPEAPMAIAVAAGTTPQSAAVTTAFAVPLAVDVRDAAGHLVQGVSVTFTAPGSGSSGSFGGNASATAVTNATGRATAPALTANTIAGSYLVAAQAAGGTNPSTSFSLTNTPAAASSFTLTGLPVRLVAGTPSILTVTARDPFDNIATGYAGTVHFLSTDGNATVPADHGFTADDRGVHTFAGVVLSRAGTQFVIAYDTADAGIDGISRGVTVVAAPAVAFRVIAPASVDSGTPFDVTLLAVDPYGNTDTSYQGTVTWTTSDADPGVQLPADYTFQPSDQGSVTFPGGVALITPGDQTITATDAADSAIDGSATVAVSSPDPGANARLGRRTALDQLAIDHLFSSDTRGRWDARTWALLVEPMALTHRRRDGHLTNTALGDT